MIWQATLNLREGTLLEGTVKKIYPYGAQIRIGDSNRRCVLFLGSFKFYCLYIFFADLKFHVNALAAYGDSKIA